MVLIYIIIAIVILVFMYAKWEANYFKSRQVKTLPIQFPLLGNLVNQTFQRQHLKDFVADAYETFPDEKFMGIMSFAKPILILRDVELIKKITVKDFDHFVNHPNGVDPEVDPLFGNNLLILRDEKWRNMRATLSPAFTSSKMRNMFQFVTEIGEEMTKYFKSKMNDEEFKERGLIEVEMRDAYCRYSNDVIATCAFGVKVNSLIEKDHYFYQIGKSTAEFSGFALLKMMLHFAFPRLMKVLKVTLFSEKTSNFFRELILGTMKARERNNIIRPDMIQLLMEARKGTIKSESSDGDLGFATVSESHVGKEIVERKWSDDEIVAQAILFFIAGFDSTSTLLCLLTHELTLNPDIQRRLQEEIDEFDKNNDGILLYDHLGKMTYLDMVVSETLRKWPPGVITNRQCTKSYKIPFERFENDDSAYQVDVGDFIWIPTYSIHHDAKYFPNPEVFDPERFSEENKKKINPLAYMPFGQGPRNCIGSRFALMETKAIVYYMLRSFDFVEIAKTQNPIKFDNDTFNLRSKDGFWIGMKPRFD